MVDTAKVTDRRALHFAGTQDVLAEVERIVTAEQAGRLRRAGNWTTGQVFNHLASWINFAYEGFPMKPPPFPLRIVLRYLGRKYRRSGMPAGIRIPGTIEGTFATEPVSTEEGAARLRRALARLASDEPAPHPSPAFGPMPHEERIRLNLRHAELHLGFLHP